MKKGDVNGGDESRSTSVTLDMVDKAIESRWDILKQMQLAIKLVTLFGVGFCLNNNAALTVCKLIRTCGTRLLQGNRNKPASGAQKHR